MKTELTTDNLEGLRLMRGKLAAGQCAECAVVHDPAQPHNQQSLFYQYAFFEDHGRWATWADAISHCTPEVQARWTAELAKFGITVQPNAHA